MLSVLQVSEDTVVDLLCSSPLPSADSPPCRLQHFMVSVRSSAGHVKLAVFTLRSTVLLAPPSTEVLKSSHSRLCSAVRPHAPRLARVADTLPSLDPLFPRQRCVLLARVAADRVPYAPPASRREATRARAVAAAVGASVALFLRARRLDRNGDRALSDPVAPRLVVPLWRGAPPGSSCPLRAAILALVLFC
ncbi:hypothetical protein OH77DRAFT_1422298 [Trametes cingulata]|nr:hypothetical protein OH77DRAFT_1422298 [Trametes cingulata]